MRTRRAHQGMQGTNHSNTICHITRRLDTSCCWGGDLSAVRRGKVAVVGGGVCLVPGFAQIADHLTHNSPFLPFFGEVVCTLGVCGCPMVCDRSSACDNDVGSNMSCVSTSCLACGSPVAHVNPLFRMWAGLPRFGIAGPRADEKGQVRNSGPTCVYEGLRAPESRRRSGLRWQTGGTTVLGVARARPAATPTPTPRP